MSVSLMTSKGKLRRKFSREGCVSSTDTDDQITFLYTGKILSFSFSQAPMWNLDKIKLIIIYYTYVTLAYNRYLNFMAQTTLSVLPQIFDT